MIDIKQTADGDVYLNSSNQIVFDWSDDQHKRDITYARPYDFATNLGLGADAKKYLCDDSPVPFFRSIRVNFTKDGMVVKKITLDKVDAYYKNS